MDMPRPCTAQHGDGFAERSARGTDVIDQNDGGGCYSCTPCKGLMQIALALLFGQSRLGCGVAHTH